MLAPPLQAYARFYRQIPVALRRHLGEQLRVDPPERGTLRSIYDGRLDTLIDHQAIAYRALRCSRSPSISGVTSFVVRERLIGRPDRANCLVAAK